MLIISVNIIQTCTEICLDLNIHIAYLPKLVKLIKLVTILMAIVIKI